MEQNGLFLKGIKSKRFDLPFKELSRWDVDVGSPLRDCRRCYWININGSLRHPATKARADGV